jgi:hypothetical protein
MSFTSSRHRTSSALSNIRRRNDEADGHLLGPRDGRALPRSDPTLQRPRLLRVDPVANSTFSGLGRGTGSPAQDGGDQMYGVVVVTGTNPSRSRIGRLSSDASTSRYRKPRSRARFARYATVAR